jgi:hypothetical protein
MVELSIGLSPQGCVADDIGKSGHGGCRPCPWVWFAIWVTFPERTLPQDSQEPRLAL